jgi:DNA-binding LytR/AlgR family response regulator
MEIRKLKCLVVDDEPIARKIVISYIEQSINLELSGECKNAIEAIDFLRYHNDIDILFLDINMPNLTGIAMAKILQNKPEIIFTTAYHEYAVESYEVDAADYILKPFSFERFTQAVYKAQNRIEAKIPVSIDPIQIKSDGKIYFIDVDDILFCESMRNYTRVFLKNTNKLMPLVSISKFENELKAVCNHFIKVHRSFIVSKKHIETVKGSQILIQGHKIPIGIQYKDDFAKSIKS